MTPAELIGDVYNLMMSRSSLRALPFAIVFLVGTFATPVAGGSPDFATPQECKRLRDYRDTTLLKAFDRASADYGGKVFQRNIISQDIDEARSQLAWNEGIIGDARLAAKAIHKVSEATLHLIAALTPEGAVAGTIADAVTVPAEKVERLIKLVSAGNSLGSGAVFSGIKELAELAWKGASKKRTAPLLRIALELKDTAEALAGLGELRLDATDKAAFVEQLRAKLDDLSTRMASLQTDIQADVAAMNAIEPIKQAVEKKLRDACEDKLCNELERRAADTKEKAEEEIAAAEKKIRQAIAQGADLRSVDASLDANSDSLIALPAEASERLAPLGQKIADLVAERERALDELRNGQFCSKCRRPASEIEREEHVTFAEHLGRVEGEVVPVTQEELDAKAAEYDDKIAAARAEFMNSYNGFVARDKALRSQREGLLATRHRIWELWRDGIVRLRKKDAEMQEKTDSAFRKATADVEQCRKDYQ